MLHYRLHRDPKSSHQQIAQLLRDLRPSAILDVGAAQGFLGQMLQGTNLTIDAVEPEPHWAEAAKPSYRNVFASSIEDAHLPDASYNAIVCADVLEHVVDPVGVLKQLLRLATPDAIFVISLPNVAHIAVRMMLLFGQFPKMDRGILDCTHLHFFTRKTATDMLRSAGLEVKKVSATGVPLDELWRNGESKWLYKLLSKLQHIAVAMLPRLFGFQMIFTAHKNSSNTGILPVS